MRRATLLFFVCILAVWVVGTILPAEAQQTRPRAVLTWKADTYTPPGFSGKALPIANSNVTIALDVFDRGRFADLSRQRIRWYVDSNLFRSGVGLTRTVITLPSGASGALQVRVDIPDYPGDIINNSVLIPIDTPKVVIETPFLGTRTRHRGISFRGIPYFFNVEDASTLQFSWRANNREVPPTEPFDVLFLTIEPDVVRETNIGVSLRALNPLFDFENASDQFMFTFQP